MAQAPRRGQGSALPAGGMPDGGMSSQTVVVTGATQGIGRWDASEIDDD
jgi:hypothetical protein